MRIIALLSLILGISAAAEAQPVVDHWAARDGCLAATTAPFYKPSITRQRVLAPNEMVGGSPIGGCVEMDLPDRIGGRGWVRIEAGRRFVIDRASGRLLRLEECQNDVYGFVPFPTAPAETPAQTPAVQEFRFVPNALTGELVLVQRSPFEVNGSLLLRQEEPLRIEQPQERRSWFSRNWPWAVPLAGGLVAAGVMCAIDWCRDKVVQETIVNIHHPDGRVEVIPVGRAAPTGVVLSW